VRAALPRTTTPARRYLSTAPPTQKSRSWKSLAARLGIAGTIIYYYNTTDIFAEEPVYAVQSLPETETESETLPTIEAISAERQRRKAEQAQLDAQREAQSKQQNAAPATGSGSEGGIEGLEEEADQQGAFNPETGEINWDCPCLGGMAHGPCGDEFKAAFSCFVFSEEEPKGMDCIDKFKDMQNCFRKYPEVYGSELEADDEDDAAEAAAAADVTPSDLPTPASSESSTPAPQQSASTPAAASSSEIAAVKPPTHEREAGRAEKAKQSGEPSSKPRAPEEKKKTGLVPANYQPSADNELASESEQLVPKAAHDAQEEGTERLERK